MYGRIFSFLFSIILTKYLITSPIHDHSNRIALHNYERVLNQSRELEMKLEHLEKSHQKRNSEKSAPMPGPTFDSTIKIEKKNPTLKTPIAVLTELLAKWKKTPTYKFTNVGGQFQCWVSFDDKLGLLLNNFSQVNINSMLAHS